MFEWCLAWRLAGGQFVHGGIWVWRAGRGGAGLWFTVLWGCFVGRLVAWFVVRLLIPCSLRLYLVGHSHCGYAQFVFMGGYEWYFSLPCVGKTDHGRGCGSRSPPHLLTTGRPMTPYAYRYGAHLSKLPCSSVPGLRIMRFHLLRFRSRMVGIG